MITNIIAVVGRGFPGLAHTAAARAGVLELTRTLAYEWGPAVRLNCVAPGAVETEGFKNAYDPNIAQVFEGVPAARYGTREEVAHAVTFLSSTAASYVTGEVLFVAGGQQSYGRNQALFDTQLGRKVGVRAMSDARYAPPHARLHLRPCPRPRRPSRSAKPSRKAGPRPGRASG